MPVAGIEYILGKAIALRPSLDALPTLNENVCEFVMFVDNYRVLSGDTNSSPGENCVRANLVTGEVKKGRVFIDIADYWNYVCGILADRAKTPGKKINAVFCFQYAYIIHYTARKQMTDEERAVRTRIFGEIQSLIEELIRNSPKDVLMLLYPRPGDALSKGLITNNCMTLTDRIFTDQNSVNELRDKFLPHAQEGVYTMNVVGRIRFAEPI